MPLNFNSVNIPSSGAVNINSQSNDRVVHNGVEVWKKSVQLWPGNTFLFRADSKGMNDQPAQAYASGNTLILKTNGYGQEAATRLNGVDFTPWSKLIFTMNGSARYPQLWFGVFTDWTNLSGANQIKATKLETEPLNVSGDYVVDISAVSGAYNAQVFLRTGGGAYELNGQINIMKIVLE